MMKDMLMTKRQIAVMMIMMKTVLIDGYDDGNDYILMMTMVKMTVTRTMTMT